MKKKVWITSIMAGLLACCFMGCGKEAESKEVCSLCEVEKECEVYSVDGEEYVVCDDCYNEFAYAFGLIEDEAAEEETEAEEPEEIEAEETETEEPEAEENEAEAPETEAAGEGNEAETTETEADETESITKLVCCMCEVEKQCGIYPVDGKDYNVCDACYMEFARSVGLIE